MEEKLKDEIISSPTIEQLEEFLNRIKWSVRDVGCGYLRIYNQLNNPTSFEVKSGAIRDGVVNPIFGDDNYGSLHIKLSSIRLEYHKEDNFVSISPKNTDSNSIFISFYNHSEKQ